MTHAHKPARSMLSERQAETGEPLPEQLSRHGRRAALPANLQPRGLSRTEAAAYVGIGASLFDELVGDGRMPPAKQINGRRVWDRRQIDIAFDALPQDGSTADPWGSVSV